MPGFGGMGGGMAAPQGGGGMADGGGMGGGPPAGYNGPGGMQNQMPIGGGRGPGMKQAAAAKQKVEQLRGALMQAQRKCSQGDGYACQTAQQIQQQLQWAMQESQQWTGVAQAGANRYSTMGRRGGGGIDPGQMAGAVIGANYGMGGGGLAGGGY